MKTLYSSIAALSLLSGAAAAATMKTADIDFVSLVASIGEQGAEGQTFSFDGLEVTLTSSSNAYLDGVSRGRPAGLGVCSSGLTQDKQCSVLSDDHISGSTEFVTISFSQGIESISNFKFRGRQHVDLTGSVDNLAFELADANGAFGSTVSSFSSIDGDMAGAISSPVLSFSLSAVDTAFYLSSFTVSYSPAVVPIPAGAALLGGAMIGLGALRRRRKGA